MLIEKDGMRKPTYASAGVDLKAYNRLLRTIKPKLNHANRKGRSGLFAGIVDVGGGRFIAATTDGVGTKVKIASDFGWHRGIGRDVVAHCTNDVMCAGAKPVAFLDYIAFAKLDPQVFRQVINGMARECRICDVSLIGGETAEMPGVYKEGEYDVAGFMIGLVSRRKYLDGSRIRKSDLVVGLPSNGLHTNGYSLARHVLLEKAGMDLACRLPGWKQSLGKVLLKPHTNYFHSVYSLISRGLVAGVAHITGGGIAGNLSRILPDNLDAVLQRSTWRTPRIFDLIAEKGPVDDGEMLRVFNMGLGMLLIVRHSNLPDILTHVSDSRVVGEVVEGGGRVLIR
jgi:phosphoribosylformylglycinamidine cyclo-ligase